MRAGRFNQGGYYDRAPGRRAGMKFTPGTGSRFNARGTLVDGQNMGGQGIRYGGSQDGQFGKSRRYNY